jgi:hypothetical protein
MLMRRNVASCHLGSKGLRPIGFSVQAFSQLGQKQPGAPSLKLLNLLERSWDTLEDYTVAFRGSPLFTQWRAMVGDYFAQPPHVEHFELVGAAFTPMD